ncbi:trafficking protein particle complex subunit 10-like [Lineus longissimus]|uniref:trafficking protein particle complex subunit 10-like n=1 Tax=Lineus longissimus TaxID=88925 RepID=UPI002B4D7357
MDKKPIVTCHGDQSLFSSVQPILTQQISKEPVEWKRSYGRSRTVYVEALFVPFSAEILPKENETALLGQPFFHIFWTDCDSDGYKSQVKDDITAWLGALKTNDISDWLIVVINNDDRKTKLLPRTSVIDRVKSDFCSKYPDRCISLLEPLRNDSRTSESWQGVLQRLRQLILNSFNKNINKFEDNMRAQRERRNEPGWNFCQYFMLQEELAFTYEMLSLFEESLIQYDELDALFTQFVVNHAAGETAQWLSSFSHTITCWEGLNLTQVMDVQKRALIKENRASLLDFRNYLFGRQCSMLFLLFRPWEVAQRAIPFMHNCVQELAILDLNMPIGSVACWVFLSTLSVLETCERFSDSTQLENYSLYAANLWEYARTKLLELGKLCGLMPDTETTSAQLNTVVDLLSGINNEPTLGGVDSCPSARLGEALSSTEAFQKHYLELSELAMGTYKHIGRIRSARLIGKDLADYYMKLGEFSKAEAFLTDAYKMYRTEGWEYLMDNTRIEIAQCQRLQGNVHRYVKSCVQLASSETLKKDSKMTFCKEIVRIASGGELGGPLLLRTAPLFHVVSVSMPNKKIVLGETIEVKLTLESKMCETITASAIGISLLKSENEHEDSETDPNHSKKTHSRTASGASLTSIDNPYFHTETVPLQQFLETKETGALISSAVICSPESTGKHFLTRPVMGVREKDKDIAKESFSLCAMAKDVELKPGINEMVLSCKANVQSIFSLHQLCVSYFSLEFLRYMTDYNIAFSVVSDQPTVTLAPDQGALYAGLPQELLLTINTGSYGIRKDSLLKLLASDGLKLSILDVPDDTRITLPDLQPYESLEYKVEGVADLPENKVEDLSHEITIECDWLKKALSIDMEFPHPFLVTHKIYTAGKGKKYIQIKATNKTDNDFLLSDHKLSVKNTGDVDMVSLNRAEQTLILCPGMNASYLWQIHSNIPTPPPLDCEFAVTYQVPSFERPKETQCSYGFCLENYKTLLAINAAVTPHWNERMCKAGQLCQFTINITRSEDDDIKRQLMYEVLPDNEMWAMCGKTTGVLNEDKKNHDITLDLMPLIGGFLPLPDIRVVKFIPPSEDNEQEKSNQDTPPSPKLIPFNAGEVYNRSIAQQVHVEPANNTSTIEVTPVLQ